MKGILGIVLIGVISVCAGVLFAALMPRGPEISHDACTFELYTVMAPQAAIGFNGSVTTVIVPQARKRHTQWNCVEVDR